MPNGKLFIPMRRYKNYVGSRYLASNKFLRDSDNADDTGQYHLDTLKLSDTYIQHFVRRNDKTEIPKEHKSNDAADHSIFVFNRLEALQKYKNITGMKLWSYTKRPHLPIIPEINMPELNSCVALKINDKYTQNADLFV